MKKRLVYYIIAIIIIVFSSILYFLYPVTNLIPCNMIDSGTVIQVIDSEPITHTYHHPYLPFLRQTVFSTSCGYPVGWVEN